ncbi:MAG TPA: TPM domain-containing protein [Bacteroidales bacterium]|nr:TPM domain-containing protein [Bacteroidales bacterium]
MKPYEFFNEEEKEKIIQAIRKAELNTSGEIRVHIEGKCIGEVLDRAAYVFEQLGMHKTKLRNGLLFYTVIENRKFAILGDAGINAVVPGNLWDEIKNLILDQFKKGEFAEGLAKGILMAGEQIKKYFPHRQDDVNELPNEISYGLE